MKHIPLLNQETLCSRCQWLEVREFRNANEYSLAIALRCKAPATSAGDQVGRVLECPAFTAELRKYPRAPAAR